MKRFRLIATSFLFSSFLFSTSLNAATFMWMTYEDGRGDYKISYPSTWQKLTKGNALVITSPEDPDARGVFGITRRTDKMKIEESVEKEFQDPEHSTDLQKAPARIANRPAIKVWGSKKGNPSIRVVEYYVQDGPHQYYILFQAPHTAMANYSAIFNKMIASMQFLK